MLILFEDVCQRPSEGGSGPDAHFIGDRADDGQPYRQNEVCDGTAEMYQKGRDNLRSSDFMV